MTAVGIWAKLKEIQILALAEGENKMKRILLMVFRNILFAPYWFIQLCMYAREGDTHNDQERFALLKKITRSANKGGRVTIQAVGMENLPDKDGFIMFPNHQGLYDALAFVDSCDRPFSVIVKKEVRNIPFLKQVFSVMRAKAIDREDVRQAMKIIIEMAKEVRDGKNYIIFAEGTRSKEGNKVQSFKGGSFKAATKAKCPIVPVAIIDAYKPFDISSIEPVTVQIHYMKPLYYEEYKDMKSTEIATIVRKRIQQKIDENV